MTYSFCRGHSNYARAEIEWQQDALRSGGVRIQVRDPLRRCVSGQSRGKAGGTRPPLSRGEQGDREWIARIRAEGIHRVSPACATILDTLYFDSHT